MRLLIVEDEVDLNEILVTRLRKQNFAVDSCLDGQEAWEFIQLVEYEVIILDILLPKMDGMTLLKKMRKEGNNTPVVFLTAKDSIKNRVEGLDAGANDYLIKPFAFEELLARLRVVTRATTKQSSDIYQIADLVMDCAQRRVMRGNQDIVLSAKEFSILELLIRNKSVVLSKETIEQSIWDYTYEGDINIIKVYIRYLRKKIDEPYDTKLIHTVRNFGYVLREEYTGESLNSD